MNKINDLTNFFKMTKKKDQEAAAEKKPKKSSSKNKQEELIQQLESDLQESKDKYLRLYAEFDNFKKRTMKERIELMKSASQDVITSLLPVLDDFDRAKKSADDPDSAEEFSEGVSLVYHKLYSTLTNKGLKKMESTNEVFDPELHDAITEIPASAEDMKGLVIDTVEQGYYLNDKIIRHAKVVVGK